MESNKILYSQGKNDNVKTPEFGVKPILKYIPKDAVIWCPFDLDKSNYVKLIRDRGNKVINTHIETGFDFRTQKPDFHFDMIVSNPPFTRKKEIFEITLSYKVPFALLMSIVYLNDSAPYHLFKDVNFQILTFNKRIHFEETQYKSNKITFTSAYFCVDFLPGKNTILFDDLNKYKHGTKKEKAVNS